MREELRNPGRLEHIMTAINHCLEFTNGKCIDDLNEQTPLYFAVAKNIEIIGEASYMLTPAFKDSHPNTNWQRIISMRHILVHGYFDISKERVWAVIQNDLLPLKEQVTAYLKEFGETAGEN